jgi:hypothetical protein
VSTTASVDRRSSKRSSPNNTPCNRFGTREHGLVPGGEAELGKGEEYQVLLRRLHPSYPAEMGDFPPEHPIPILILLACCRRLEAERDFGILNSPTDTSPDLPSILTGIVSKQLYSGERSTPRAHGLFQSPRHGDRALIVDPIDPPQNGNRIVRSQRRQIRVEGRDANASEI